MYMLFLALSPIFVCLLSLPFLFLALQIATYRTRVRDKRRRQHGGDAPLLRAGVVSLSPGSHSPRATNHALSFVRSGKFSACIHAYAPCPDFDAGPTLSFLPVAPTPPRERGSLLRTVKFQAGALFGSLVSHPTVEKYDVILINSPPCIPVFAVVWFAARVVHSCPVIVDWHNFAYTIMQTTGKSRSIVAVARFIEWFLGRQMDGHFCVSGAMARHLAEEWAIDAHVLYDRPPDTFRRIESVEEQHSVFMALHDCLCLPLRDDGGTIITLQGDDGVFRRRPDGPAVIVSSTSWTPDEDFNILMKALVGLDLLIMMRLRQNPDAALPFGGRVACVITGKGPMRSEIESRYGRGGSFKFSHVRVYFAWLPQDEYPRLLGCADLGISLHTSSSGLDLPMKVVDMLGCGLPVLSYDYQCIEELVVPEKTGLLFKSDDTLSHQLFDTLFDEGGCARRCAMAKQIEAAFSTTKMRWQETWERDALPYVTKIMAGERRRLHTTFPN